MPNGVGAASNDNKATIIVKKSGSQVAIPCHFNPTDYTLTRSVSWKFDKAPGKDMPLATFQGGDKTTLTLKLLFDTSMEEGNKDVRDYTKHLWDAAMIDPGGKNATTGTGEPAHVVFMWGPATNRSWNFEAVVTNLTQDFILFREDGTPIRSNVTLALTQIKDEASFARQNPTSGGIPGEVHLVREGDRLDLLAARYYKKATLWRYIAEHNDIDNPRQLKPGQRLIIPPLP
jgi:hypothetical protein